MPNDAIPAFIFCELRRPLEKEHGWLKSAIAIAMAWQSDLFASCLSPFGECVEPHFFCRCGMKLRLSIVEFSHHLSWSSFLQGE